ncbi:MAG TPA: cell surface protein SprA [Bacteroidales bacterium]|nr:cell surface protein SprA [Bacteroidales bacterium]
MNGRTYRVGELSTDGVNAPKSLIVKLLKGTNLSPNLPTWKLMMKNIYSIGAYQVEKTDFTLNVLYHDDKTGTSLNYIPEEQTSGDLLISALNLDNVNSQQDPYPDGVFDFIQGVTINPSNGRVIFPVLEPFGSDLKAYLKKKGVNEEIQKKYLFQELYDSTKTRAEQVAEKNKFLLASSYQSSSSSEIPLNAMNVPQGSVVVTAGARKLTENVDYTVDYTLGRVKIINEGLLQSGTPIKISLENQSLFNIQTKTLVGTHLNYQFNDNFYLGGTILHLNERPLTQKVNIGDEPISDTIWGLNGSYKGESQFLTTLIDKLPFLETKAPSSFQIDGEFADLIPGSSKAIGKNGVSYIDDFEGSETSIELKSFPAWVLASTPQGQDDLFPEGNLINDLAYGYNRAKFAWYVIDPLFLRNNALTPSHIKGSPESQSSAYVAEVNEKDIWPNRESPNNIPTTVSVLNLAYYPNQKGPYNYDLLGSSYSAGINANGFLNDPVSRWGGMMREIQTNDFEAANVEYIEFWMMDPYVEDSTNQGGDLYFNLGDVSEDILRDGRKSFENGLPVPGEPDRVDTTVWGRIPQKQQLVNGFNNDPAARAYQDVGLDGLDDTQEQSFFTNYLDSIAAAFGTSSAAYLKASQDPSNDDFHYFRGSDYDANEVSILERYKNYNGMEGNSPTAQQSQESYPTSGSTLPDAEDINRDNTLSEAENYYQYHVSLRPQDLVVGKNYIVDKVSPTITFKNKDQEKVTWYQFRIPIQDFEKRVGSIQDFKSIRFMRMFMRNFNDSVILRFATLRLIRGEWRKYSMALNSASEGTMNPQPVDASFEISAVNIEENAKKTPVNYVLPPGIDRVIDPTNPQLRQLNEQSIVLKVNDLTDNDARAAFKNVNLDVRQYKRLKMAVHAEAIPGQVLNDGDLTVFIRIGSDYKDNYYEYEVPLKVTPPGNYNNDNSGDRLIVWPDQNQIDVAMDMFLRAKQARNDAMRRAGSNVTINTVYPIFDGDRRISVCGNPNLSNIRTIMIGVRNPGDMNNPYHNDRLAKSGEIWLNELRLTDFNDHGGWAANARASARLADFGTVTLAGTASTPGFGSIEKKVNDRSKEEAYSYDFSTNLELGKFFPEKAKVSIPAYIGYSESFINPEYNPLDPDIPLKAALDNAPTKEVRDSIKKIAQDYTRRKSLNFTNVKINKNEGKPKIYDISNFAVSYSYNETFHRNISTEYNEYRRYRGALSYNFNARPKNITPLSKMKFLNAPVFRIIKDFNFTPYPANISFRTEMNRQYNEIKLRNISNPDIIIKPTVRKDFMWNRYYDLSWNLTRSLKMDFSATNMSRIDEPQGRMDKQANDYEAKKDSILQEILRFGRTTNYTHSLNATYNLPINKIPLLNWISANASYRASFGWDAGPITADTIQLGNTVKNSNTKQLNGQLNFQNLYNKVGFLKKIDQQTSGKGGQQKKLFKTVKYERKVYALKAETPRAIYHRLGTEDVTVQVLDEQGNEIKGDVEIDNPNKISFTAPKDYNNVTFKISGKVEANENPLLVVGRYAVRALMGVRNVSFSYSETEGTLLPGFMPTPKIFGNQVYNDMYAPGIPFALGWQDNDFVHRAANDYNWLTTDSLLTTPYLMSFNNNFNIRSSVEPLPGLKIDLNANRTYSKNTSEYFNYNYNDSVFNFDSRITNGNFSMSFITLKTAFEKTDETNNYSSAAFNQFKKYRQEIAFRLATAREQIDPNYDRNGSYYDPQTDQLIKPEPGFYNGFGPTSPDVLIPAFLAAYSGSDPSKITTSTFPSVLSILPNWRVTFDGLSRIEFIKKYLNSITLGHAYRSSYNIGSYTTNLDYNPFDGDPNHLDGLSYVRDIQYNFLPQYQVNVVSINEQFSPLINVDMTWKNSLSTRIELKKSRTISLSFANNQVTEIRNDELVFGAGYRFNEVPLIIRTGGTQKSFKSDLNVRTDLSIRDNKTILRKVVEDADDITAGQRIVTIKFTADYMLSDRFNLRFFFDRVVNNPFVSRSGSYPTANTNVGFSVRFTLAQ